MLIIPEPRKITTQSLTEPLKNGGWKTSLSCWDPILKCTPEWQTNFFRLHFCCQAASWQLECAKRKLHQSPALAVPWPSISHGLFVVPHIFHHDFFRCKKTWQYNTIQYISKIHTIAKTIHNNCIFKMILPRWLKPKLSLETKLRISFVPTLMDLSFIIPTVQPLGGCLLVLSSSKPLAG